MRFTDSFVLKTYACWIIKIWQACRLFQIDFHKKIALFNLPHLQVHISWSFVMISQLYFIFMKTYTFRVRRKLYFIVLMPAGNVNYSKQSNYNVGSIIPCVHSLKRRRLESFSVVINTSAIGDKENNLSMLTFKFRNNLYFCHWWTKIMWLILRAF